MSIETATFGAGCFWGVEYIFERVPGVLETEVGYAGGLTDHPTYREVCSHTTGHAEVVRVTFDPQVASLEQLLEVFWAMHDPTQVDRQGPDVGDQYRSVVFTGSDEQRAIAEAGPFWPAEDYHQRYYGKNGHEPYCHAVPWRTLEELGLVRA